IKTEKRALVPTELGVQVTEYLEDHFKDIMDVKFTAQMEKQLDDVENGTENWQDIVGKFYPNFVFNMEQAGEQAGVPVVKAPPVMSDVKCELCGAMMVYREGRNGRFLGCSNYPQCKNTKRIDQNTNQVLSKVEDKGVCPKCGGVVSAKYSKRGKLFFGCDNYPKCDYISWDLPLSEKCPMCGNGLYKKFGANGKITIFCQNKGCNYAKEN
ncbi:MAG: topoisomerase DNA-binding C4 zinc finger domain-containing protein, partial [Clostridia bacterium]|nr:topoisomerase DNA-binding C4 zinc finger domain-containing protein [Clostridia bacterium]